MKKRTKRIISVILCIALVLCMDNMSVYRDILSNFGKNVVIWAASGNENSRKDKKVKNKETTIETVTEYETEIAENETEYETETDVREVIETETQFETEPEFETELETETFTKYEEYTPDGGELSAAPSTTDYVQVKDAGELLSGETYAIKSIDDWKRLFEASQTSTLSGVTFVIYKRDAMYDNWTLDASNIGNNRIGNKDYPFSGTIYSYYATTVIYSDRVLFEYLSSKAHIGAKLESGIKTFIVAYTKNVEAGLATNLVIDKDGDTINIGGNGVSNYYFELSNAMTGSIFSTVNNVGGLFSKIYIEDGAKPRDESGKSIYNINVEGSGIDLSKYEKDGGSILGVAAGGIAGEIAGDIDIEIKSMVNIPKYIKSYGNAVTSSAGGFAGRVYDGVKITFKNTSQIDLYSDILSQDTSRGYYMGGFVGYMENAVLYCDSDAGVIRTGNTKALRYAGGLVGYAKNSSLSIKNYVQDTKTYITQTAIGEYAGHWAAGGVIGIYENNVQGQFLDLSFIKTTNKNAATPSQIYISTANNSYNKRGGLVGIVDAQDATVNIHDINTDALESGDGGDNCYYVNMIIQNNSTGTDTAENDTGGIAGIISGTDINIENIKLNYVFNTITGSNSLAGFIVGGISARVGCYGNVNKDTKMQVKNVTILNNYIRYVNNTSKSYYGGLFGLVYNSAIALSGTIDVSKVSYKTYANSTTKNDDGAEVTLAAYGKRGFIAGGISQSFIYQDTDCEILRSISYDADGNIEQFDADTASYKNVYNANTESTYMYCIDDIGDNGSILKNVNGVLDISKDYSDIVTGKVTKDPDGYYVIDSIDDALRLAIAGNSVNNNGYPQFGGKCFLGDNVTTDITFEEIFSSKFRITTDLNLKDAGIHSFVSNFNCKYQFTGTFEGVVSGGKNPVITIDFISKQCYGGLFPAVKDATFKNIDINGNMWYLNAAYNISGGTPNSVYSTKSAAGSIAAYATGNIDIDNVNVSTHIKSMLPYFSVWSSAYAWCYGGMFGLYNQGSGVYTCKNSVIAPKFTSVYSNQFVGGMIGWMFVAQKSGNENMSIAGCTISTKIIANKMYTYQSTTKNLHGRSAGLIATIASMYSDVGTTGSLWASPVIIGDDTKVRMSIDDTTIDGVTIDLTNASAEKALRIVGGALGYAWAYVDVDINNLTVKNTEINSCGVTGGLISYAAGRFDFDGVNLESLKMTALNSDDTYCGFLIGNGQNSIVNLKNYNIAQDGSVSADNYASFDEIVGLSMRLEKTMATTTASYEYIFERGGNVDKAYANGGIVNIINDNFGDFSNTAAYRSYENKVIDKENKYTRYYYNLFTGSDDEWTVDVSAKKATVDSAKKFMTYSVATYINSYCNRFIKPYLSDNAATAISEVNITEDIDLNGYSYYPISASRYTRYTFGGKALTLYAKDIYNLENNLVNRKADRDNENSNGQHYMMHASIFANMNAGVTVENLTLRGTGANLGENTGGLISCGMSGIPSRDGNVSEIKDIILDGFKINGYADSDSKFGLMIAHIGNDAYGDDIATKVEIEKITTMSYADDIPVASSLIGYVGSESATDVNISFKNMKLEDERNADNKGKIFEYASFIYDYEFTTDVDKNKCYLLYTFTKDDCDNDNVTFGEEIKDGVEYFDCERDSYLEERIIDAANKKYIPYVYMKRNIYVNPRTGSIKKGCGTYEDPYIITETRQFITLYLYLTNKEGYDSIFIGSGTDDDIGGRWKVVPVGGDDGEKSECSDGGIGNHVAEIYGSDNFPTRAELSTAYYKIEADIDLSFYKDMNDKYISNEFSGLGSEEYPFAGVIVGTKGVSGRYIITLPEQRTDDGENGSGEQIKQSEFGLIQYMGGAVVKDIEIRGKGYNNTDKKYYNILRAGGGVAAQIIGGDNIIDNVKVCMNFNINNDHKKIGYDNNDNQYYDVGIEGIGGIAGIIKKGTLVLRNYQNESEMVKCTFEDYSADKNADSSETGDYDGDYNETAGIIIGRVYDGNVIYEGYQKRAGESEPLVLNSNLLDVSGGRYTKNYPLVNGFHILNSNVLENNQISYSYSAGDTTNKNYTVTIENSSQLVLFSIAMNSDALSVLYTQMDASTGNATGYSYYNRCRKAEYSDVGSADALSSQDRQMACKYDDNNLTENAGYLYPYLCWKYMDYTDLSDYSGADVFEKAYNGYKKTLSNVTLTYYTNTSKGEFIEEPAVVSNTNKIVPQVADYETTYVLKKDSPLFDLTEYGISFRGIGELYNDLYDGDGNKYLQEIGGAYYTGFSDFRGNFDGNGNTVKFILSREFDEDGIVYSGFFNRLTYNQQLLEENASSKQLEIKNLNVKNSLVYNPNNYNMIDGMYNSNGSVASWKYQNTLRNSYAINPCATGIIAGAVQGAWKILNVDILKDSQVADAEIIYDVSGYKSVGGLIGRINNTHFYTAGDNGGSKTWYDTNIPVSNNIEIEGCDIVAENGMEFEVAEKGSSIMYVYVTNGNSSYCYGCIYVGGLIGGIGTNTSKNHYNNGMIFGDVSINDCSMNGVSVVALNKGNVGGFTGSVGTRMRRNMNQAGYAAIGNVTITGKTGGTQIKKLKVDSYNNLKSTSADNYSSGGMIGTIDSPSYFGYGGSVSVSGYNLENLMIDTVRAVKVSTGTTFEGAGGVVGYSRCNELSIIDVDIAGNTQIGYEGMGKSAGGILGLSYITGNNNWHNVYMNPSVVNIAGCSVADAEIIGRTSYAGGIVGADYIEQMNLGTEDKPNIVKNVKVSNEISKAAGGALGGVNRLADNLGRASEQSISIVNTSIVDTSVINKKNDGSAGGLIGEIDSEYSATILKDIYVYTTAAGKSNIEALVYAGGLFGSINTAYAKLIMEGKVGIGACDDAGVWNDNSSGINIKGQYSGGIGGIRKVRYEERHTADIMVAGNKVYSYIDNNSQQSNTYSGGIYGKIEQLNASENHIFNKISIKNNVIFTGRNNIGITSVSRDYGKSGCGGVFGYVQASPNDAGIYLPELSLENNSIGYYDASATSKKDDWDTVALDSRDVKLYDSSEKNLKAVNWDEIPKLGDDNIAAYSIAFGQFIGVHSRANTRSAVYILAPDVRVDKDIVGSVPVIDVGCSSYVVTQDQTEVTYQQGEPYLYRRYVHIVYADNDFSEFKSEVEKYQKLNESVNDIKEKNYNYITAKRLNMYVPHNDASKYSLCTGENNYYNLTYNVFDDEGNIANILNNVPVLILDGLNPQTVGDYAAAILTNAGGVASPENIEALNSVNSNELNNFWQITAENAYIDTDGSIKNIEESDVRFSNHRISSIQSSNFNRLKLADSIYDEIISDASGTVYTITLLKYTYICKGAVADKKVVVEIPVFVREKVTLDTYIRILSDEEYSLIKASTEGYKNEVTISHDSVYTIYTEFVYDAIRLKDSFKNDVVEKSIIFEPENSSVAVVSEGTKFTLVDYQTGIPYYYVSDGSSSDNEIPFSAFKDKDGVPYENRNIGDDIAGNMTANSYTSIGYKDGGNNYPGNVTYTDQDNLNGIGIERFFISVQPPENANTAFIHLKIGTYAKDMNDKAVDEFFNKNINGDAKGVAVTYVAGPMVQFGGVDDNNNGTEGVTYISGKISADTIVDIDANIEVGLKEMGSPYWDEKDTGNTIDSSNNSKYLEVAVTLIDQDNNVVAWPSGTNVSVNGGAKTLLKNNLVTYSYKNMGKQFPVNNVIQNISGECYYYNISEDEANPDWRWVYTDSQGGYYYYTGFDTLNGKWLTSELGTDSLKNEYIDITNQLHMSFDFSAADLDEYSGNNYKVMLKLYRSDSPEYPNEGNAKAYESKKRQYTGNVSAESNKELAVALEPDELTDLGINLYNSKNNSHTITFTNRFDFNDLIRKNREDATATECAKSDYMVTYRLYKKTVSDNQVSITPPAGYNENIGSIKNLYSNTRYELMDWKDSPFELYDQDDNKLMPTDIIVNDDEEQSVIVTTKSFTKDEILNGTDGVKYVAEWKMDIVADLEKFTKEDLTNYMISVSYVPYEKGTTMPQTDQHQTLFDYFIFTVAKLKTDM